MSPQTTKTMITLFRWITMLMMTSAVCRGSEPIALSEVPTITVGGQVWKPGPVNHREGMTLVEAVKAAGGATEFGTLKRVVVYREDAVTRHDLRTEEGQSFKLLRSDTVEVPQLSLCSEEG